MFEEKIELVQGRIMARVAQGDLNVLLDEPKYFVGRRPVGLKWPGDYK
jgi:hypothetical protein